MGINIPENQAEGSSFENAMKNSKSTASTLRKTDELENYRKLTVGVETSILRDLKEDVEYILDAPSISSDK